MIRDMVLTFLAITMSFTLGWCMCGYKIYGKMYQAAYENPAIVSLATKITKRR